MSPLMKFFNGHEIFSKPLIEVGFKADPDTRAPEESDRIFWTVVAAHSKKSTVHLASVWACKDPDSDCRPE